MAVKVNGKYISISINNEYTKLCEATKGVKATTIHKVVTIPTPEGVYNDGEILDVKEFAKVIKSSLDDNRMNSNDVVFSISSSKIATKDVIVPDIKSNKIDKIIETNAAEYFPVKIEDYIVQYYPIEKIKEDNTPKLKVVVVAAPANMIEQYYELAQAMGLKVAFIDYAGNSTYQLIKQQIDEGTNLVISIENDSTLVSIFKAGALQLQRTVHYGKTLMVKTVMDEYKLNYDQALQKLQTEYLLGKTVDSNDVTESVRALISNISRITDYYVSRNNTPIEKIYIIGNATTIRGFNKLLTNEFNMEVIPIEKLDGVLTDKRTYVDENALTAYTATIGAFIAPVNFVSLNKIQEDKKKDAGKGMALVVIVAVAASLLLVLVPGIQLVFTNIEVAALKNDVKKLVSCMHIVLIVCNLRAERFGHLPGFCCILPAFHDKQVVFQVVVDGTDTFFFDNALLVIIPLCFHLLYSVCCLYGIIDIGCQIHTTETGKNRSPTDGINNHSIFRHKVDNCEDCHK